MTPLPSPITFDFAPEESVRLRRALIEANGGRRPLELNAFNGIMNVLLGVTSLLAHLAIGWLWLGIGGLITALSVTQLFLSWRSLRDLTQAHVATTIGFDDVALRVERVGRGGRPEGQLLPLRRIRGVRLIPDALIISGSLRTSLLVPRHALPDDGAPVMRYFADRLIGKSMLQQSSSSLTTIVNTALR